MNKERKERSQIHEGIEDEKWLEHFETQLEGKKIEKEEVNENNASRKGLEGDIEEDEIAKAIKKLKRKKAMGIVGLPNEAWVEGINLVREELKDCLNTVWKNEEFPKE